MTTIARFIHKHVLLLLSFLIVISGMIAALGVQLRSIDGGIQEQWRRMAVESADDFALHAAINITLIDGILKAVRHIYEHDGIGAAEAFLAQQAVGHDIICNLVVAQPDGTAVSIVAGGSAGSVGDRAHFRAVQASGRDELVIGLPIDGRMSHRIVIPFARPLHQPDGSFAGMIAIAVEPELFARYHNPTKIGINGIVALIGMDQIIRARGPATQEGVGLSTAGSPLWAQLRESASGTFWRDSRVDGMRRLYAYRRVPDYPLVATVGIAQDDVEGQARGARRNMETIFAAAGALLTVILVLVLMQRELHLRVSRSREQLRLALDATTDGLWDWDVDAERVAFSRRWQTLVGCREGPAPRDMGAWDAVAAPEDRSRVALARRRFLEDGSGTFLCEYRAILADGSERWLRDEGKAVAQWPEGRPRRIVGTTTDVTQRKKAEAETQLAASVFQNTAEGILVADAEGAILSINPAFTEITGFSVDEVIGKSPRVLKSDRHEAPFYQIMWDRLLGPGRWQGEIWNRRKSGEAFLAWQTITSVRDEEGRVVRFVSVFNDITELHRKEEQIRHQAYHDALTGLPNRMLLQDRLGQAINLARRDVVSVALMFIDLDRFKVVNDSLGHDVGDLLLTEVGQRLQGCLRRSDTIARLGGDEFMVVLADVAIAGEVVEVAEKLINRLVEPMPLKGHDVQVGASIGIALYPQDGEDVTTLMKNADTAMYRAKNAGRNTFRFFDSAMDGEAAQRLNLENGLRRALEKAEFELYFQPKIALADGSACGAEALIRWNCPERGLVLPMSFIPLAEETGLILRLGNWVLQQACRQLADWRRRGLPPVNLSVNVSVKQFLEPGFADQVAALLAQHAILPSQFEIELTESGVAAEPEIAIRQLARLREIGVMVSIDDFGTGYSSLNYLKRLPLNAIKIGRSFVQQVDSEPGNAAIIAAILGLAKALGLAVIAEGVETAGEETALRGLGCPMVQGFRYSVPLPAGDFERWMAGRSMAAVANGLSAVPTVG